MEIFSHRFRAMGGPCEVRLHAADTAQAQAWSRAAEAEVLRLEQRYSRYRQNSVTSRINGSAGNGAGVEVDAETAALLDYAATAWRQSEGLFDITSGVLRQAWDFKAQRVPSQEEIDRLLPRIGWDKVQWQPPRLVLPRAGMELDFGGYVKEYAADRAAQAARAAGARHGLVELAGDIAVIGPHPDGTPWLVGVSDPRAPQRPLAAIPLSHGAIASSGDYERYFERDGRRYCHILDPRSGWPVRGLRAVSVVAEQCLVAGTACTIAMLKGDPGGRDWLRELGLQYLCVDAAGEMDGTVMRAPQGAPVM